MATRLAFGKGVVDANASGNNIPAEQPSYEFDGVSSYATIPDWTPLGLPFEVSVEAVPLTGQNRYVWSHDSGSPNFRLEDRFTNPEFQGVANVPDTVGGSSTISSQTNGGVGTASEYVLAATGSGTVLSRNGAAGASGAVANPLAQAIRRIGQYATLYYHGPIYNVKLTDNSPIQDTWVNYGDGTRYGVLDEPIVLEGDFEIEWEGIRQDVTGTGSCDIMGLGSGTPLNFLSISDTANPANANRFSFYSNGALALIDGAFDNIALGQHYRARLVVAAGVSVELFLDYVSVGVRSIPASALPFKMDRLYRSRDSLPQLGLPQDSALKNISIKDLSTGRDWFYALSPGNITGSVGNTGLLTFPADLGGGVYGYDGVSGAQVPEVFGLPRTGPEEALDTTPNFLIDRTSEGNIWWSSGVTAEVGKTYLLSCAVSGVLGQVGWRIGTGSAWDTTATMNADGEYSFTRTAEATGEITILGDSIPSGALLETVSIKEVTSSTIQSLTATPSAVDATQDTMTLVLDTPPVTQPVTLVYPYTGRLEGDSKANVLIPFTSGDGLTWTATVPFAGKTFAEAAAKSESVGTTWTERGYTYTALDIVNTGNTAAEEGVDYPIYDTTACFGDGARYVELDNPIVIEGDFEIELDVINGEAAATATWEFIGDAASTSFLAWFGSGLAQSDALQIYAGGVLVGNVAAGMDNIAIGQHFTQKISRVGGTWTVETDGVVQGTNTTSGGDFTISAIGDGRLLGRATPANSAIQNIRITTPDNEWLYTLDEGTGTAALNTGNTQGNYDNLPMYDTDVLEGDGTRYIEIPEFTIPAGNAWTMWFDMVTPDYSADVRIAGKAASTYLATFVGSTDLILGGLGSATFANAFDGVAGGQHISVRINKEIDGSAECFIDGVSVSTSASSVGEHRFNGLYTNDRGTSVAVTGTALQNVTLENLTTGEYVQYKIDEGTGELIGAYNKQDVSVTNTGDASSVTSQPMWETNVLEGDGTRYIEMPSASYASTDEWRISADVVFDTTGNNRPWGNEAGTTGRLLLTATDAQLHDSVLVLTTPHGLSDGEHATFTAYRQGSTVYLEKNGVVLDSGSAGATAWSVDRIGRQSATGGYGSFQNVTLENLTTGEYVQYRINEGSGTEIKAYDRNGDEIPALGNELNPTPSFDVDTGWTLAGNWEITGGQLSDSSALGFDTTRLTLDADYSGTPLTVVVEVASLSGTISVRLGNVTGPSLVYTISTTGTHEFTALPIGTYLGATVLTLLTNGIGQAAAIDSLSIKRVTTGTVTPDASWSYTTYGGTVTPDSSWLAIPEYTNDGAWTPDTDWQYVYPYGTNGEWTPDTDWQFIEDNTRYYPMNDQSSTLRCIDGTGSLVPSKDGTIQNYDPTDWSNS